MSQRLSRKNMKHDKFVDEMSLVYDFIAKHRKELLLATVVVAALVAAGWGWMLYRAHQETVAQERLADAIDIMEKPVGVAGADGKVEYKDDQARFAAAQPVLLDVVGRFGSSDAADVAGLYLARIDAANGNTASAKTRLEAFIKEHPDHILAGGARMSLYELDIRNGEATKVAAELEKRINDSNKVLPTDALLVLLARAYESAGESAKSQAVYQRISTEFPDSPYAIEAQQKLPRAG